MPIKIPGTYCPLCGDIGLFAAMRDDVVWAYCAQGATGPEDAHTAYIYPRDRLPAEVLEYLGLLEADQEYEEDQEDEEELDND